MINECREKRLRTVPLRRAILILSSIAAVMISVMPGTSALAGTSYSYEIILPPPGWSAATAEGVNDSGIVAGNASENRTYIGFIYSAGTYTLLTPPGWGKSAATAINNRGMVTGSGQHPTGWRGFLYDSGTYTVISPPGWWSAEPYNINENGEIVGTGMDDTGVYKGFLYSNGIYTELLPPGWINANAYGINSSGSVVGSGETADGLYKGYIYESGSYTEISPDLFRITQAQDINNIGMVAGNGVYQSAPDVVYTGFIFSAGTYTVLSLEGGAAPFVMGVNDLGDVAGWGWINGTEKGFVYNGGRYREILPATWLWGRANRISSSGIIAGHGDDGAGSKGFIAIPQRNLSPAANAGPDHIVHAGRIVSLDGSSSSDPDNDPLTYSWRILTQPEGSRAVIENPSAIIANFVPDLPGIYTISLVVTDIEGAASSPAMVTITATNTRPIARAGADQSLTRTKTVVHLDGSSSYDPDGDAITYRWKFVSIPERSEARIYSDNTAYPRFVADVRGTYVLKLIVRDTWERSESDFVTVSFTRD